MSQPQRDMSGVLFKNGEKKTERHPDYTGRATLAGTEWRISAWIKEGGRGKFLSLAFTPPRGDQARGRDDDNTPF